VINIIWGLLGQTGDGKTAILAYWGFLLHLAGTIVHSNIHFNFPYEPIENIEALKELPLEGNRIFLLDELAQTGDSYDFNKPDVQLLTSFIVQARKVDADVIHTTQTFDMIAPRIRRNTSLLMHPRIVLSYNEKTGEVTDEKPHPNTGIVPYIMNVKWYDTYERYLGFDEPYMVYPCHMYYNTRERVKPTPSLNTNRLFETYKDFTGTRTELQTALVEIDRLSRTEAKNKANFIILCKNNPEYYKLFLEKQKR
jgi:hypothetical protein